MTGQKGGSMDDLISRQSAIDALTRKMVSIPTAGEKDLMGDVNRIRAEDISVIRRFPSAQPETHDKRTETHSCDCISRQAAMEEISKQQTYKMFEGEDTLYLDANDVGSVLASLPSAQPELPEWAQKVEEYRKSAPSFVRNQLVWALYQTWKEYDGQLVHQRGKENR